MTLPNAKLGNHMELLLYRELALCYKDNYQFELSDSCFQKAIDLSMAVYGKHAEQTLILMGWWAASIVTRNMLEKAEQLLHEIEQYAAASTEFSIDNSAIYHSSMGELALKKTGTKRP